MMKIWIMMILLVLSFSLQVHDCDAEGQYSCRDNEDCCEKFSGDFYCCPEANQCRIDGQCDLALKLSYSNAVALSDIRILIHSFLKSIDFFEQIPKINECIRNVEPFIPDVINLINKLKEVKSIEELIPIIIGAYSELSGKLKVIILTCKDVPSEIKEKIAKLIAVVSQPEYIKKIIVNIQKNFLEIFLDIEKTVSLIKQGDHAQAGVILGNIFEIIFTI